MGLKDTLIEVFVVPDEAPDFYAYLTGRWYISTSGSLRLEILGPNIFGFYTRRGFFPEGAIKEIQGKNLW
jgi:hypothetical protein